VPKVKARLIKSALTAARRIPLGFAVGPDRSKDSTQRVGILRKTIRFVIFANLQKTHKKYVLIGGRIIALVNDDDVSLRAFVFGNYEVQTLSDIQELTRRRYSLFVDVGANIGLSTIAASQIGLADAFIAIEPVPENYRLLEMNLQLNDVRHCATHLAAVSDKAGVVTMEIARADSGDHRVRTSQNFRMLGRAGELRNESQRETMDVSSLSLDQLLPRQLGVLIKIDVQGHESFVLEGARQLIQVCHPDLLVEFWPYGLNRAGGISSIVELGRAYGSIYDLDRRCEVTPKWLEEMFRAHTSDLWFTNLLFSKRLENI